MSEFGDNQVPHQCVGKGQQGIKPLPPLSFRQNLPSLRLGEMLAQYLNGLNRYLNMIQDYFGPNEKSMCNVTHVLIRFPPRGNLVQRNP